MDVPAAVRNQARLAGAQDWLAALPDLVRELEQLWSITAGDAYPDATEAYVATAVRADGTDAVLKLLIPQPDVPVAGEITVLRIADGDGCVRLIDADITRSALLLERLGPSLHDLRIPMLRRHDILCDVAARVWRPAPESGLPTGADRGRELIGFILSRWDELDGPCSERAVAHAIAAAERRVAAHDDERVRLVHGDVHQWNALRAGAGWKLVDPAGLLADPEYDLGVIMREDPEELIRDGELDRAHRLAARTGCDVRAIVDWGAAQRVATGLLLTSIGVEPVAAQMLEAAEAVARAAGR